MENLPKELNEAVNKVKHPAIDLSLIELGIVKSITLDSSTKTVHTIFAFPFPNIPIAGTIIDSIMNPVTDFGYDFKHEIVLMTEEEKNRFLELEKSAWKGL
jgi:ATP-binding protein involved in chromosome partitioning